MTFQATNVDRALLALVQAIFIPAMNQSERQTVGWSNMWVEHPAENRAIELAKSSPHSARLAAQVETKPEKNAVRRLATTSDRTRTPTSMFRSWAASVKLADDTKAVRPSITMHLA